MDDQKLSSNSEESNISDSNTGTHLSDMSSAYEIPSRPPTPD